MQLFKMVNLAQIRDSLDNPRSSLTDLAELAESIKVHGILQPLIVRKIEGGDFELIAGARRAAAAEIAGLDVVPCVIREQKGDLTATQLVENTQRVDLKPHEIASGVLQAMTAKKMKQKDLAKQLGKSEVWISKYLTIGKALDLVVYESDRRALMGDNGEIAYARAQAMLHPEKPSKKTAQAAGTDDDQDEPNASRHEDPNPDELAFIKEQRERIMKCHNLAPNQVEIIPRGSNGWHIILSFKTERDVTSRFNK